MTRFRKLFEPGRIGTLEVRNRIAMAPVQADTVIFAVDIIR